MIPGRIGCELPVLAVLCILTIFLFPAMQGPYSAVHGPATALLADRAALQLRGARVQAANCLRNCLITSLLELSGTGVSGLKFQPAILPECNTILRC